MNMEKEFSVSIEETVVQDFKVFASNAEEAMRIAEEKYQRGIFILSPGEPCYKQMAILNPAEEATEWTSF